jgi:hypothetical protein
MITGIHGLSTAAGNDRYLNVWIAVNGPAKSARQTLTPADATVACEVFTV